MNQSIRVFFLSLMMVFSLFSCKNQTKKKPHSESLVQKYGVLQTKGNKIVDKNGQPVSLAGNSFFWSNPYWKGVKFFTKETVDWLVKDWHSQIIRVPLAADPTVDDSYVYEPEKNLKPVERLINAAIDNGIYVIVDWHSQHAEKNEKQAIDFFKYIATKYGDKPNIIYEIYNEPLKVSWDTVIKPYAENVIKAIRKIDPDNLIVVGTPHWSQDVDIAAENPITGYKNIAYTLHFYAGSHFDWLHNKMDKALQKDLPLFVTEWGTVEADGDGKIDHESVKQWMQLLRENHLSHCNWSVNDKTEGASILKPGANIRGGWKESDLTESGKMVRKIIKNWQN